MLTQRGPQTAFPQLFLLNKGPNDFPLWAYYVPGTVLGTWEKTVNKTGKKSLPSWSLNSKKIKQNKKIRSGHRDEAVLLWHNLPPLPEIKAVISLTHLTPK